MARRKLISAECGVGYRTPKLLFYTEPLTMSWPQFQSKKHGKCVLHWHKIILYTVHVTETHTTYIFRQTADGSSMFFEALTTICQKTRCPNPDHILYLQPYEKLI